MTKWFEIKAQQPAGNATASYEVLLLDEIGAWGITAQMFVTAFNAIPKDAPVRLIVNSDGGSVFDALAIYHAIKAHGNVTGVVFGVAASAATTILMACSRIEMPTNTWLMVHNVWGSIFGASADEMREQADFMDGVSAAMRNIYAKRTGKDGATVAEWMSKDTWFTAQQALEAGLCDVILEEVQLAASANENGLRRHSNAPDEVKAIWAKKINHQETLKDIPVEAQADLPVTVVENGDGGVLEAAQSCLKAQEFGLAELVLSGKIGLNDVKSRIERACGIRALADVSQYPKEEADKLINENVMIDAARVAMQAYEKARGPAVITAALPQSDQHRLPEVAAARRKISAPPATAKTAFAKFNPKTVH